MEKIKSICRNRIILPYLRRLFETSKSASVTRKRVESVSDIREPDEEIMEAFTQKYNELLQVSSLCVAYLQREQNQVTTADDVIRGHCVFMTLQYLNEHFSKDRVDMVEQYIKNERAISKHRKRYMKVPSGRRSRFIDLSGSFSISSDHLNDDHFLPVI